MSKVIVVGSWITGKNVHGGEKPIKVEDIREVDGVTKYYGSAEGVSGVHAVPSDEVIYSVTAEQNGEASEETDEAGNEEVNPVGSSTSTTNTEETVEPTITDEEGNGSEVAQSSPSQTSAQQTTQGSTSSPSNEKNQQQNGKNNKRRV